MIKLPDSDEELLRECGGTVERPRQSAREQNGKMRSDTNLPGSSNFAAGTQSTPNKQLCLEKLRKKIERLSYRPASACRRASQPVRTAPLKARRSNIKRPRKPLQTTETLKRRQTKERSGASPPSQPRDSSTRPSLLALKAGQSISALQDR